MKDIGALLNIIENIKHAQKIAICGHIKTDADSLGSTSALYYALLKMNKIVDIFCDDIPSFNYNFIGTSEILNKNQKNKYDLFIVIDTATADRLGIYTKLIYKSAVIINIDHHSGNAKFGNINYIDSDVSSAGEIIFELIKLLGVEIDAKIATAIYAAISGDTGCFTFDNTKPETYYVAGDLLKLGANMKIVNFYLFKRNTKNRLKLISKMYNSFMYFENDKIIIIPVFFKDLEETGCSVYDTHTIVSHGLSIDSAEISVMITEEKPNKYTVSLRSKDKADSNKIAMHFGGGGHAKAAGFNISGDYNTIFNQILTECKNELEFIKF
ncbi:MAG: bifunctional oligoribonuclease/PAP phosphatase NrnA [Clostridia bacterium]|jgi:phosphoesterase RecJ-like protein|nr:bifunctional oligoribonuclease/PAP phosphatase NrnA [Clostridia bacterium]MDD4275405.1 bifunctional oligoribonuclease/PAP phosphatase NrnA [Clostridia bacterium]